MTALYVPGTDETDPKKMIMSQQLVAGQTSTNTTNIATNTADIATANGNITTNTSAITALQTAGTGLVNSSGSLAVSLSKITASLGADVAMNVAGTYFDGPSVAQGTTGTWFAFVTVSLTDTATTPNMDFKLWDGTTIIASARTNVAAAGFFTTITLSGFLASPAANIKLSGKSGSTTSKMLFNATGNSKDSTITAIRIA